MLRAYVTHPVTSVENEYAAKMRPDHKFEPGTKLFNGEADLGEILLDDPDGTLDYLVAFAGKRKIRLTEDASGAEKTFLVGRIASKEYDRGHFRAARGREFTVNIEDANADLRGIIVHNFVRPAETGYARVLATIAAYLNGASSTALNPVGDPYCRSSTVVGSAYVQNAGNVSMPAETYSGTDPLSVLRACAEWENKRMGVYINDNGTLDLYYAPQAETSQLNCTLTVSDLRADLSATCFSPEWIAGPALHTDADETLTGMLLIHEDGLTYDRRATQEAIRDRWEEAVYSTRPAAQGTDEITTLLDARVLEQPRRQFAIRLPDTKVHLVKAGMRITVLSAVASAIDSSTSLRIVNVRYTWLEDQYNVIVTLETPIKLGSSYARPVPSAIVAGGTPIYASGASATLWHVDFNIWLGADIPTLGGVSIFVTFGDGSGASWLTENPGGGAHWYMEDDGGFHFPYDGGAITAGNHTLRLGVTGTDAYGTLDGVTVTAPKGTTRPLFTRLHASSTNPQNSGAGELRIGNITGNAVIDDFNRTDASDWEDAQHPWTVGPGVTATWSVDGAEGHISDCTGGNGFVLWTLNPALLGSAALGAVIAYSGHEYGPVLIATADGVTTAFTFPYPYVSGTLMVYVDNILQNSTEDDPSTGAFSLSWTPASGDRISAKARLT